MGPLDGIRVIEMAGLAPAPFGGMILADLGADVVRVDRPDGGMKAPAGPLGRGKKSVLIDIKDPDGVEALRSLAAGADVFVDCFRPGVAERRGIGPDDLLAINPRLVYARMTGWGQTGPLAPRAGHDINYIELSGALEMIGRKGERPVPPVALLGDMGGGGLMMAMGILAALYERERSGQGQVIDVSIVEGAALLTSLFHGMHHDGSWNEDRGTNLIDGGAAFYDTFETADGKHMAVGPIEPQFFFQMQAILWIDGEDLPAYLDPRGWDEWRPLLTAAFLDKTRDEWTEIFADSDACVTPVLSPWEAHEHPHNQARESFIEVDGVRQPAPAPRFSRTPAAHPEPLREFGADVSQALLDWS